MRRISILCASRGRPARFEAMVESAMRTASRPERVSIYARLDEDDPTAEEYMSILGRVNASWGPRLKIPEVMNALAEIALGEILMTCADDVLFRTTGWDAVVDLALGDGRAAIAVPMDGAEYKKGLRCTHFFVTREWIRRVGYLIPPEYEHFYADTHVADIGLRAGRLIWLREVLIEHMHPNLGKAQRDPTYASKREGPKGQRMSDRDQVRYEQGHAARALAAERVRGELVRG